MKQFFLFLAVFFSIAANATDHFSFKLDENHKLEKTFSVDINPTATLHMVIAKNKDSKMYDMMTFYMDANQEVKQMETVAFEEIPEILSYHQNGDTVTLLAYENDGLSVVDFNSKNGLKKSKRFDDMEKPETVFKTAGKSVILTADKKGESLSLLTIENSETSSSKEIAVPETLQKQLKNIFKTAPEALNTNEYVTNGSIAETQAYYKNGKIIMVTDEATNDEVLESFTIDPAATEPIKKQQLNSRKLDKIKDSNSYVTDEKLFSLVLGKDDVNLSVFDLTTGTKEKDMLLSDEIAKVETNKSVRENFLKEASRSKNKPTVSVNKTSHGNYAITMDYVDKNNYHYYNNWFWMHQMMFQQQMMMNQMGPGGFGPNSTPYEDSPLVYFETKSTPITLVLDKNMELLQEQNPTTEYVFIDKEKYMESLNDNKNYKNTSAGFLENEYRYMYSDKDEKTIYIKTRGIKRRK